MFHSSYKHWKWECLCYNIQPPPPPPPLGHCLIQQVATYQTHLGHVGDSHPALVVSKEESDGLAIPEHISDSGILQQGGHMHTLQPPHPLNVM